MTNYTEIRFTTHGFDRVRKTGANKFYNIRVGDGFVSKLQDSEMEAHGGALQKIRNLNFCGYGIAPSSVSRRFMSLWEERTHDKFLDSVKVGFVKVLEAKHDLERNILDERCNRLNARILEITNSAKERAQ